MINLILCGGSGTRLWPISRTLLPKQFVKLFDNLSLFQLTVNRNKSLCKSSLIVSNTEQYFLAIDQLNEIKSNIVKYILEPVGRNTAPAIAIACMAVEAEEVILVTPSDHLIKNKKEYEKVVNSAKELAQNGFLVTFGIKPTYAETGYGYINAENFDVKAFVEKPDFKTAQKYFEDGNYYWNSGIFCFKAGVFLDELKKHSPKIYEYSQLAYNNSIKIENSQIKIKLDDMLEIPEDSIDYAVMERSDIVKMVPADISWSDLGSFDALYSELEKDEFGNSLNENHIAIDSKNNLVIGNERKIATIGVEDFIIVDTPDALLVSKKGSSQKVKDVVKILKELNSDLHNIHLTTHRPWGKYTILEDSSKYKIKKIEVQPGKRLSLQKHFHRNEHWIVVSGTATVQVGDEIRLVRPNESTYIKMGEIHRLSNDGKIPVVLIEAQVGEYTGEDDIVRIDDDFCRG